MVMENPYTESQLTQGQQLMWLGQKLQPNVPLYNMIYTFIFDGVVDSSAFGRAFKALVEQDEHLRTVIVEEHGVPQPRVLPFIADGHSTLDLSDAVNPQVALESWVDKRRAQPFDMNEKLFDSVLLKLAADRFVWYFAQHHIIMDVGSSLVLYGHMARLYQQILAGEEAILGELPSYRDYREHEQALRQTPRYDKAHAYWQDILKQPSESLDFFGRKARSSEAGKRNARTDRLILQLDEADMAALQQLALQPGIRGFSPHLTYANIFTTLLIAYVYRLTHQPAIRLGMPLANRSNASFQQTLGLFIEVLSTYVQPNPEDTFRTLFQKVAAANLQALNNTLPGIASAEHNRAFEVLLNYITVQFPDFAGIPTETVWVHSGYGDGHHKLRLQVHDFSASGSLTFYFDFSSEHFSAAEQSRLSDLFMRVMRSCLSDITQPIVEIGLLSEAEDALLLRDFNATEQPFPAQQTVLDLFDEQVARTPEAIALSLGETRMSYAQLQAASHHLALALQSAGVHRGDMIPVCLPHSFELMAGLLALLRLGAAYVPLDPSYPDDRLYFILQDLPQSRLMLTTPELYTRFSETGRALFHISDLNLQAVAQPLRHAEPSDLAYLIYTSGSTGKPKGVLVHHEGLCNYLSWISPEYSDGRVRSFALYSSLAFDLTVTSLYVPLITGGSLRIYPDSAQGTVIREIFAENAVDVVKLTPSHLALLRDMDLRNTRIRKLIVGGEDFRTELAQAIDRQSNGRITLYNEYGPTEATVACMLHAYQPKQDIARSVPIGKPANNMRVYLLDAHLQPCPPGMIGELYLAGAGVARGYLNQPELTDERFLADPFVPGQRMYKSGDLGRWLASGQLEFLGRADSQVKVNGFRIELGEIESQLSAHPAISAVAVLAQTSPETVPEPQAPVRHCLRCGLASSFPGVNFDEAGVCNLCKAYDSYQDQAQQYFRDMGELEAIARQIKEQARGDCDCIALLSGGKDSSYMLHRLVDMGLRVLSFTLDNGYISDEAKANIRRATSALGVDHIFGETPFMNAIFVDSLKRYANVCNGCFKTLYTLAVNLAREKGISTIVTGLSRGQFFETRLTEEVFRSDNFDVRAIDESIARARKAYHQQDDIVSRSLDVDVFRDENLYQDIQFVNFYRYCDVDLDEVYAFLEGSGLWLRPSDTGRSTNCLINDAGIYVHKKRRGFHNYALPYSWDVRLGHKTREAAMAELDDDIDEKQVQRMLNEIGYNDSSQQQSGQTRLVAYYSASEELSAADLRAFLGRTLPDYMIPAHFVALEALPLTPNGKINTAALPEVLPGRDTLATSYVMPRNELEESLAQMWQEILHIERVGIHDSFFDLGGHSLPAIRISSRIQDQYEIDLPLDVFFSHATVAKLAEAIEEIMLRDIDALSDEEVLRLLNEDAD